MQPLMPLDSLARQEHTHTTYTAILDAQGPMSAEYDLKQASSLVHDCQRRLEAAVLSLQGQSADKLEEE